jgi:tol-pal system protein YbgF
MLLALVLGQGCAHQPAPAPTGSDSREEIERLRLVLDEREQTIAQLQSKLALLEAGQRALAEQIAAHAEPRPSADTVEAERLAMAARSAESARAAQRKDSEPRPLLRLHGEGEAESREFTAAWQPPTTSERLSVAPLPTLPSNQRDSQRDAEAQAEALYAQALDLVRRREFPAALRELDAFMRTFPGDARIVRALFWRGEVLFAQREYARALSSYQDVIERAPEGDRAADALLRIARCQMRLGAAERARSTISELRDRFPNSEAARAALRLEQEDS